MNWKTLLEENDIEFREAGQHHHTRPGWIQTDCPLCGDGTNKFHLGFNVKGRYFHCWKCGRLQVYDVVQRMFRNSDEWVLGMANAILADKNERNQKVERLLLKHGTLSLPKNTGPLKKPHKVYLKSRKLNPDHIAKEWGVKGIGLDKRLAWRLWIPIHYNGKVVSWTTRSILPDAKLRYISAKADEESIPHKTLLYGEDKCHGSSCIVHEGPADVWKTGPGAVATFGTSFTQEQIARIARFPLRIICFDSSPDGQRAGEELADQLSVFQGRTITVKLKSKDAGSATSKEIEKLRNLADLDLKPC